MGHGAGPGVFTGTSGASPNADPADSAIVATPAKSTLTFTGTLGEDSEFDPPPAATHILRDKSHIATSENPYEFYSNDEIAAAKWLHSIGIDTVSIKRYEGDRESSPDSFVPETSKTLEIKTPTSINPMTLSQRIVEGSEQSSFVVVHHLGSLDKRTAMQAIRGALTQNGSRLERVIVTFGGGHSYVEWNQ